jgi:hypothetical protein
MLLTFSLLLTLDPIQTTTGFMIYAEIVKILVQIFCGLRRREMAEGEGGSNQSTYLRKSGLLYAGSG